MEGMKIEEKGKKGERIEKREIGGRGLHAHRGSVKSV